MSEASFEFMNCSCGVVFPLGAHPKGCPAADVTQPVDGYKDLYWSKYGPPGEINFAASTAKWKQL